MKIITDERCTGYSRHGHPERPQRITEHGCTPEKPDRIAASTGSSRVSASDDQILRAHEPEILARLQIPQDFDADTPFLKTFPTYARASVAAALDALKLARAGENVFSLMRPPGHHATRNHSMGFCYLNNIAIAVLEAVAISSPSRFAGGEGRGEAAKHFQFKSPHPSLSGRGEGVGFKRVAVFDFDVHHGNGTEDILLDREGVAFFSIHQHPCYPGTGAANVGKNCFNYPVAPSAPRETYRATLARALADLKKFSPDLIAVSAGFDAYARDPLAQGSLLAEDFHWLGQELRALKTPFFSLLEGGYSRDLPELIFAYLKGVEGK